MIRNLDVEAAVGADPSQLIAASPIVAALDILPDRWSWLIMRDLFLGVHRFEALKRRTGAARGTLAARLSSLVEKGLVYRNPYQSNPIRFEYRLTDKGLGLYPCALMIWAWETKWTSEHENLPEQLLHRTCDSSTFPELRCTACGDAIKATDVSYSPKPGRPALRTRASGGQRRRARKTTHADGVDTAFFHAVDIIGDRWTGMVLAALLFGLHRYDDIAAAIGIATNILSDRLRRLEKAGVIERRAYRSTPTRYDYRLTQKGRDIYGFTLALHQWACEWLVGEHEAGLLLQHKCGNALQGIVTCDVCDSPLDRSTVAYGGAEMTT